MRTNFQNAHAKILDFSLNMIFSPATRCLSEMNVSKGKGHSENKSIIQYFLFQNEVQAATDHSQIHSNNNLEAVVNLFLMFQN